MINSFRGIKYILKVIKRTFEMNMENTKISQHRQQIRDEYDSNSNVLFEAICTLMGRTQPKSVAGPQCFIIRNFVYILEAMHKSTSNQNAVYLVTFINSYHNKSIYNSVEMMLLIKSFLDDDKLQRVDVVNVVFPSLCRVLQYHMNESLSLDQRTMCIKLIEKCISYINTKQSINVSQQICDQFVIFLLRMFPILNELRNVDIGDTVTSIHKIFGKLVQKNEEILSTESATQKKVKVSKDQLLIHGECFIAIAELAQILQINIDTKHIQIAIETLREQDANIATFIIESVLKCCDDIIMTSTAPNEWILIRKMEVKLAVTMFVCLGDVLKRDYLSKTFDIGWKRWLCLGIKLLLINNNDDGIKCIVITKMECIWNQLPTNIISILSNTMVSEGLQLTLCDDKTILQFIIDAYFKVIETEFECSNSIDSIRDTTIDQMDYLISTHSSHDQIDQYLYFFHVCFRNKYKNTHSKQLLRELCCTLVDDIQDLYYVLIEANKIPNDAEHEDEHSSAIYNVLTYFESSGKHNELYNRYIHKLGMMHQKLLNHVEAALCFKHHAERLLWSDTILSEDPLLHLSLSTEWKRHENILELALKHFILGEAWEMAVEICQELAEAYQHKIFDLDALSVILQKQAHLWKLIESQDRVFSAFYLVSFRGIFDNEYRNKSLIYRSGNSTYHETVRDFTNRIKQKYRNATIKNSSDIIPDEYNDNRFDGQFIQITTLSPSSKEELNDDSETIQILVYRFVFEQQQILNLSYRIPDGIKHLICCFYPRNYCVGESKWERSKLPFRLKKYYRENELNVFYYTAMINKRRNKNENEFRNLWIRKTFVVAQDILPSIRRCVRVINRKTVISTPLQTATVNIIRKTHYLKTYIAQLETDGNKIKNIAMNLNGILDAAVMGGVDRYREAFFDGIYLSQNPKEIDKVSMFATALKEQCEVAQNGLDLYHKCAPDALLPHVDHLKSCYKRFMMDVYELCKELQNIK